MWKFLKNLFKVRIKDKDEFKFQYDDETEIIVTKKNTKGMDEYDVVINTYKDLDKNDFIKILSFVKKRI